MKKVLFISYIVIAMTVSLASVAKGQGADQNEQKNSKKLIQQIKRVSDKAKKIESSTKEILIVLKKLMEKKQ